MVGWYNFHHCVKRQIFPETALPLVSLPLFRSLKEPERRFSSWFFDAFKCKFNGASPRPRLLCSGVRMQAKIRQVPRFPTGNGPSGNPGKLYPLHLSTERIPLFLRIRLWANAPLARARSPSRSVSVLNRFSLCAVKFRGSPSSV